MGSDRTGSGHSASPAGMSHLRSISPGMTILVVDPDLASAERLADALRQGRHTVAVAGTARAALTQMERAVPDLIITEVDLPDANGVDLVARWRDAGPTRHTLLMIVTARRSVRDKIAGLQAGADDYLVKPVALSVLLGHIAAISRFRQLIRGPLYS